MLRQGKALTILLLLVLTASTLTAIEFIGPAKANPLPIPENVPMEHAYIKSNGDIEPPTLPIQRSGNYYTLKDNLVNYTIDIQTSNVVFDGNGFLITIPPYAEFDEHSNPIYKIGDPTINISNKSNIIIKNTRFDNCFFCIEVTNSSNITVTQNSMVNGNMGVYMTSSTYCNIIGNEITDTGLRIIDSSFLDIAYNKISRNLNGAWLTINNSNINRNEISDNYEVGLYLKAPNFNNRIFENNFLNNNIGLLYRGNLNTNVNNTLFSNYWNNNQAAVKNVDYGGVPNAENDVDQSPLATPIPFDSSQFPLPSPAPTPFPTPATNPPANTPTPTTSPSPSPTLNSTPTATPNPSPTQTPTPTPTLTTTPNPTPESTQSPTPTISPSNSPTQQPTIEPAQSAQPTIVPIVDGVGPLSFFIGIVAVVIVAVAVSFVFYFKRLGKNQEKNYASKNYKTKLITHYTHNVMWVERVYVEVW